LKDRQHLTREQLAALWHASGGQWADDAGSRDPAAEHLASCATCRRAWDRLSAAGKDLEPLAAIRNHAPSPGCPAEETIRAAAGGVLTGPPAETVLEHAAGCDFCGGVLRLTLESFREDLSAAEQQALAAMRSAQSVGAQHLAERLRQSGLSPARTGQQANESAFAPRPHANRGRSAIRPSGWSWVGWPLAAAAVVLLIGGTLAWRASREPDVNRLLAQAYTEQRPMELRIAGAAHSPVRVERGSADRSTMSRPLALGEAEVFIARKLTESPDEPKWLAARGRAELLNWNYEAAIKFLSLSREHGNQGADVLIDLGSAYFGRAASESDRASDYGLAVEFLGKALESNQQNPLALFNRSLALQKMGSVHEAMNDLELYLRVAPQDGWADEARQRLEDLRKVWERTRKPAAIMMEDPGLATPILQARAQKNPAQENWPAAQDEEYLSAAVRYWMPNLYADSPADVGAPQTNQKVQAALHALAEVLRIRHGDLWLGDLLQQVQAKPARPQEFAAGAAALKRAAEANLAGDPETARQFAATAMARFASAKVPAAVLRAREELVYAQVRAMQPDACLREAKDQLDLAEMSQYPWLKNQMLLWYATCLAATGSLDRAGEFSRLALEATARSAYGGQHLRSILFASGFLRTAERNWQMTLQGLQLFWKERYDPFHAYESFTELAIMAEEEGRWHLARILRREALAMIQMTPDRAYQAMACYRLGVASKFANDLSGAASALSQADLLLSGMPSTATRDSYFGSTQVDLASVELKQGKVAAAEERLVRVAGSLEHVKNSWILFTYYNTLSEIHLRQGRTPQAMAAFQGALQQSETRLRSLDSDADRLVWQREMGAVYRNLVAFYLQQQGGEGPALDVWEWFRAAPLRSHGGLIQPAPQVRAKGTVGVPSLVAARSSITGKTFVSYFLDSSSLAAWVLDDRGVQRIKIQLPADNLERHVRRFGLLCSRPTSAAATIREEGRFLYDALIAPLDKLLAPERTIVFIPDGFLQELPWPALLNPHGAYLGTVFSIVISPGIAYSLRLRAATIGARAQALVVSVASPGQALRFPPLPDAESEGENVASHFARAKFLKGDSLTRMLLGRELGGVQLFHFAGHAIVSARLNGLVLSAAKDSDEVEVFGADDLPQQGLQNLQLVVLSACDTTGETANGQDTLVQGFLRAGVPHVLATRWQVDSKSTAFMIQSFYKHLLQGSSAAASLQQARIEMLSAPGTAHPAYWASFQAFGV